jgi:hypothetical protein
MSPKLQTYLALAVVAVAAAGLVLRLFLKKGRPGCGGDCGCATDRIKSVRGDSGK